MRLLPLARFVIRFRRRHVAGVMHPAVPSRRDAACLGKTVVDHPAPLKAQRGIDRTALGAVVAVSLFILADQLAVQPCPELGAKRLAVPPGEYLEEEMFH